MSAAAAATCCTPILEATPQARGILFDLPAVVEAGGPAHPRLVRQAGDFFVDPLPAADTYLVMDVIHDWADAEALAILTAIRRAAMDDAKVLLIEGILPENLDPGSLTIDVIMLAVTGGRERTDAELGGPSRRGWSTARHGSSTPRGGSGSPRLSVDGLDPPRGECLAAMAQHPQRLQLTIELLKYSQGRGAHRNGCDRSARRECRS